jgi:peptide/nickel transport system permease protein
MTSELSEAREGAAIEAWRRPARSRPWYLDALVRLLRTKPLSVFSLAIVAALVVLAVFAPWIAPAPPDEMSLGTVLQAPSPRHIFGTDSIGRDEFSRIVYGSRISLAVGLGAIGLGTLMATILGVASGYVGGAFDLVVQRIVDAWISIPWLVLLLAIMTLLKPGLGSVIFALALGSTFANARIIRSAVLSVVAMPYVEAERALGAGSLRIMVMHVLPNALAPIIVVATLGIGNAILAEAALSYLGFGVPPPAPDWGGMLSGTSSQYLYIAPWLAIFPGLAIGAAVFAFNMLGDGLRDVLDPRLRRS